MMSLVLADVDPAFARQQYDALRTNFVDYNWGIPAGREYPHGVNGASDVDSGPLVLGFSGPASVLGAGAAIANGDDSLAGTLLAPPLRWSCPSSWAAAGNTLAATFRWAMVFSRGRALRHRRQGLYMRRSSRLAGD
jgi:hypothetical protein